MTLYLAFLATVYVATSVAGFFKITLTTKINEVMKMNWKRAEQAYVEEKEKVKQWIEHSYYLKQELDKLRGQEKQPPSASNTPS